LSLWHMANASSGHWVMLTLSLLAVVFAAGTLVLLFVLSLDDGAQRNRVHYADTTGKAVTPRALGQQDRGERASSRTREA
jgi:hypothetical protein